MSDGPDDDLAGWHRFAGTRAGRREERQERARSRLRLAAGAAGVVTAGLLLGGLSLWRPWSSAPDQDTGDAFLGADRVTILLSAQGKDGTALLGGLLVHDRVARRGGIVVVPTELMLPVSGEGRVAIGDALAKAGPTLTREALGDALGVTVDGSWVLPRAEFARFVDRLGGAEVPVDSAVVDGGHVVVPAGTHRLDGSQVIEYATYRAPGELESERAARVQRVLTGLAAATPKTYPGVRDLLASLGVVGDAGLPVERLAAVLSGVARDASAGRLRAGALLADGQTGGLDVAAAAPLVREVLGGRARTTLADVTPRVMVQLPVRDADLAAEVRASLVGAGYDYVDGGPGPAAKTSVVTVRAGTADARPVGEAVALTLGLDRAVVKAVEDLPLVADVLVVIGSDFGS
jgi:cell envelope-related transcriptional attenuator-like protein/LytR cell envelope-related transcriptional attenuator